MNRWRIQFTVFWRSTLRHRLLLAASLGGIAAGTGVLCALRLANDRAIQSFEISARGLGHGALDGGGSSIGPDGAEALTVQWRAAGRQIPVTELAACLASVPDGVQCRGVIAGSFTAPDGRELQVVGWDGGVETLAAPIFSSALRVGGSSLKLANGETIQAESVVEDSQPFVILDFPEARKLLHQSSGFDWIEAKYPHDFDLTQIERRFHQPLRRTSAPQVLESQKALTATYRFNLNVLGWMSLLVGALLVANVSSLYALIKRPAVAALRQLGATRREILFWIGIEQLTLGLVGGALGLVLGLALESFVSGQVLKTLANLYVRTAATQARFSLAAAIETVAAGCLIYLVAGLRTTWSLVNLPPAALGRRVGQARATFRMPWAILGVCFAVIAASPYVPNFALPAFLGVDSKQPIAGYAAAGMVFVIAFLIAPLFFRGVGALLERLTSGRRAERFPSIAIAARRARSGGLRGRAQVATLAGGVSLVIGVNWMVGGFRYSLQSWLETAFNAAYMGDPTQVQGLESRPRVLESDIRAMRSLPSVEGVDCILIGDAQYQGRPIRIGGIDDVLLPNHVTPFSALEVPPGLTPAQTVHKLEVEPGYTVVSETFANKFSVHRDDTIDVDLGDGHAHSLNVLGISREFSSEAGYVLVSRALFKEARAIDGCSAMRIYAPPTVHADQILSELKKVDPTAPDRVHLVPNHELYAVALGVFDQTFAVTGVLSLLSAILGGLSLLTQLIQSTEERRPEWVALRRIGATRGRLVKLCAADTALAVTAGMALGGFCGTLLGWILCKAINLGAFGWSVDFGGPGAVLRTLKTLFGFGGVLWVIGVALSYWVLRPVAGWSVQRE